MSNAATLRAGADLAQIEPNAGAYLPEDARRADADFDLVLREAERLGELAAAFALFGLRIDVREERSAASAETAYRDDRPPTAAPANDAGVRAGFPELTRRGLHVSPTVPAKLLQAVDWFVIIGAAQFAALWGAGAGLASLSIGQALAYLLAALTLKGGLWLTETYRFTPARVRPERAVGGLALGAIAGLIVANLLAPDARGAAALAATLPVAAMLLAGLHGAFAIWIAAAHRAGAFSETVVLVGATEAAARLGKRAMRNGDARIVAVVDDRLSRAPHELAGAPVAGSVDDLLAWDGLPQVDRIVIAVTQKAEARVRDIIERLRVAPNRIDLFLDYDTQSVRGGRVDRLGRAAVACVSGRPHNLRRAIVKRTQDVLVGGVLLALFAAPMLLIAAAIKLDSKGPALYRQRRHGFNNRIITVLKFRTMRHDPDAPLAQVRPGDPRVTRIGKLLRRTSLDELPQLFNVLRGEMSLVGPRPHAVGMKAAERELHHIVAEYAHRHRVKPGITGWAQINGSRGPIETAAAVRRRLKLDLAYVSRASLWLDLQILLRTAPALLGDARTTR